jgi:hypothetical protein
VRGFDSLDKATELVAEGREAEALRLLRDAVDATSDPELLRDIHELAAQAHDSSRGFHRIEWHKLMLETEGHTTLPAA